MKKMTMLALFCLFPLVTLGPADAGGGNCKTRAMAGDWVFATGIGRQMLGAPFPPDKDITAIGTMSVNRDGSLGGRFDATVEDTFFLPDNSYAGSIQVNADCTGTVQFLTSAGTARTDSIVVVSRSEFLGMSQDVNNLWTYQARRIGGRHSDD